ncbi:MAG: DUF7555 family protein [Halodesulfurarchaeum sp.]
MGAEPAEEEGSTPAWVFLEVVQYAVAVVGIATVALTPVSVLLGGGLVGVKIGLFLVGTGAFGYAIFLAWPSSPADLQKRKDRQPSRFQRRVRSVPPLSVNPPPPSQRASQAIHMAAVVVLSWGVSYGMETIFGVVA